MDRRVVRLLYRLSLAVVALVCLVLSTIVGVELPFVRAGRELTIFGLLGSAAGILLVSARLAWLRQPDSRLAALAPNVLFPEAIRRARELGARPSAARHRRRRDARVRETERVALEAAEDDERLAPERIRKSAEALFRLVYLAWDARSPRRLASLLGPELRGLWERALDADEAAGKHQRAEVLGDVKIDLVGLTRVAAGDTTAVVLIQAELQLRIEYPYGKRASSAHSSTRVLRLCEYWTLVLGDHGPWTVHAIEERAQGDRHLTEPLVASPGGS